MDIHTSALKHGVSVEDIEHAVETPWQSTISRMMSGSIWERDRKGDLLEVVAINRRERSELVIHAMPMRSKYRHLIPGE